MPKIKCIIAGSRAINSIEPLFTAIHLSGFRDDIIEVVSGAAQGIDTLGELWAHQNGIPIKRFPANWRKYGKSAGVIRNQEMARYADALIAVWDGQSKGTLNMIQEAKKRNLKVYVYQAQIVRNLNLSPKS